VKISKGVLAVVVAALGYFVDIYDLILFSMVRLASLKDLGFVGTALIDKGLVLINVQMLGMLIGGVIFGSLGDKRGRLSVLFGSILLYSIANLLNAHVHDLTSYAILRFVAGVGLAGELGAGITLVSESLPKSARGWGTTIIASVGVSGAVLAWSVSEIFDWRMAYTIGGGLGLSLLALRLGVAESGLFASPQNQNAARGRFRDLFRKGERARRFLGCIFLGFPTWYLVGILMTFASDFAPELQVRGAIIPAKCIMLFYVGLTVGDFLSGTLSQLIRSRKKAAGIFIAIISLGVLLFFKWTGLEARTFYGLCFALGVGAGYWAIFVTVAAEQFGTNLRATAATTIPNFVRGALVPISALFTFAKMRIGIVSAGFYVGIFCLSLSVLGLMMIRETYDLHLDYFEE
jgi:predicted MFS family arabinose efflux permease